MSLKFIILLVIVILAVVYLLRCVINNIDGTWVCDKEDGEQERITIWQFGPIVRGVCEMEDGKQFYTGRFNGRRLTLKRMDYGLDYLEREGFPRPIAEQLEGTVMATMEFRLSADKKYLSGTFHPQAIEFVQNPPKIRHRRTIKGKPRRWVKLVES